MNYSCEVAPSNFKVMYANRAFPKPINNAYYYFIANEVDTSIVDKAIAVWQKAFTLLESKILLVQTTTIKDAHIIISWGNTHHKCYTKDGHKKCPFDFDGSNGVLAHAWPMNAVKPFSGQLHIDTSEDWEKNDLLTVLIHELGHVFNLDHSDIRGAVMFPSYTGKKTKLTQDDLNGLAAALKIVGVHTKKQTFWTRVLNMLK